MRPNAVGIVLLVIRRVLTGKEDEYIVDLTVAVIIILGEIDAQIQRIAGVDDHLMWTHVFSVGVVLAIILAIVGKRDRPVDIKMEFVFAAELVVEISHRGGIAAAVDDRVEIALGVVEFLALAIELGQDDDSVFLNGVTGLGHRMHRTEAANDVGTPGLCPGLQGSARGRTVVEHPPGNIARLGNGSGIRVRPDVYARRVAVTVRIKAGIAEPTVITFDDSGAVKRRRNVQPLITDVLHNECIAVWLGKGRLPMPDRNGPSISAIQHCQKNQKVFFQPHFE